MPNRYSGYTASFNAASLVLNQIGGARKMSGSRIKEIVPSGMVDRAANVMSAADPACQIQTDDLTTALGTISPTAGYNCTGVSKFQYQKRADMGVFSGAGANVLATLQLAFMFADTLAAAGDNEARLALNIVPLWDGTNDPVAFSASQNLSGTAPAFNSHFYLGPAYLNGSQLTGLLSTSISFGIGFSCVRADGDPYCRAGSIIARRPMFKFTFEHLDMVSATIGSFFHGSLGATMAAYFRKGSSGGVRVADASAVHCKVSCAAGTWGPDDVGVQEERDGAVSITVRPTGSIAVSVASAIP
jgi:hypothetical protein